MGASFLDDLDDSFHIVKKIKSLADAAGATATDVGSALTPMGWGAGAVVDIARLASSDSQQKQWDKGWVKELGLGQSLSNLGDLFADEHSLTGGAISGIGKGFHTVSEHGWLGAIEGTTIKYESGKTANPLSWAESYNASLKHSAGDTFRIAAALESGLGIPQAGEDNPLDFEDPASAEKARGLLKAQESGWDMSNKMASTMGVGLELADPTFLYLDRPIKSIAGAAKLYKEGKGLEAMAGRIKTWDASEIFSALRLDRLSAGPELAGILAKTKDMEPAAADAVIEGVRRIMHKDPTGVDILAQHDPLAADTAKNIMLDRATQSIDAGLADDAADEAGRASEYFRQPEVVAAERESIALDPAVADAAEAVRMGETRAKYVGTFDATAPELYLKESKSGNRALDRLYRIGRAEDGSIESATVLNGSHRAPVTIFNKPLRAIGWASGITPTAKLFAGAGRKVSDSLRDQVAFGLLDTNDAHLSVAVGRHLLRVAGVSQETAQEFLSRVIAAPSASERASALHGLQDAAIHSMARRHNRSPEIIQALLEKSAERTNSLITSVEGQGFSGSISQVTGHRADMVFPPDTALIMGDDGHFVVPFAEKGTPKPLLGTGAANHVLIQDLGRIEKWLKFDDHLPALTRQIEDARGNPTGYITGTTERVINSIAATVARETLETGNGWLKTSMLLPRFPAYAARNLIEEELRTSTMRMFFPILGQAMRNRKFLTLTGKTKGAKVLAQDDLMRAWSAEHESADAILKDPEFAQQLKDGTADPEVVDMAARRDELDGLMKARAREIGVDPLPSSEPFEIPGTDITVEGAHQGPEGRAFHDVVGGKSATVDFGAEQGGLLFGRRYRNEDAVIDPPRVDQAADKVDDYYNAWAYNVNRHHRADPLAREALAAKRDGLSRRETQTHLESWLHSPVGRRYRKKFPEREGDEYLWVSNVIDDVGDNVPTGEFAGRLLDDVVTKADIKEMFPPHTKDLPHINRAGTSAVMGAKGRMRSLGIQQAFQALGRMTTDQLVRHPFFALHYQDNMAQATHALLDSGMNVTPDMLLEMQTAARKSALFKLKRSFYQNAERSSAANQLRFMSPFFAAHQDSVRFWVKALGENPEWLRRATVAYGGLSANHVVTDKDGNPVETGEFPSNDHVITIGHGIWHWEMHPSSWLLMLQQGTLTNPGYGQFAQIPMSWLQKGLGDNVEAWNQIGQYVNPFGPKDQIQDYFVPEVWQRVLEVMDGHWYKNSDRMINLWHVRVNDAITDYKVANGGREPSDAQKRRIVQDAKKQVRAVSWLKAASSFAAPFQGTPVSAYSGIIDEHRRLQAEGRLHHPDDPFWAEDQWLRKYGTIYSALTYSTSASRTGLDSTTQTGKAVRAHEKLLDRVNGNLWGLVIGPEGKEDPGKEGEFNANTYRHIRDKLESSPDYDPEGPLARAYSAEVAAGNAEYARVDNLISAVAEAKGLKGAEESKALTAYKRAEVQLIGQRHPDWEKINRFGAKATTWNLMQSSLHEIVDGKTPESRALLKDTGRGDIRLLKQYVDMHDTIQAVLLGREAANPDKGSADITAKSNEDLRKLLAASVVQWKSENTDFQNFTMRYVVNRDPFYDDTVLLGGK